jgi:REP-associated tyrosine transposase
MKYNPDIHHRRSIRLKGYDYSQAGLYFITICTQNRLCLFGEIENGGMQINDAGIMIEHQWQELIYRFDNIKLHEFIVMPNHFHGIIKFVGVPLVGTQNVEQPSTMGQPTTMEQPTTMGQPQGIAPTLVIW